MGELADFVTTEFAALADPEAALHMAAYMKSEMPFWGIKSPQRVPVLRAVVKGFPPTDGDAYRISVRELWDLPHREDKYAAIHYARAFKQHHTPAMLDLFEWMVRDGAWWDFVDDIASNLVGATWLRFREEVSPIMDAWITDDDMWIRRSAILGQLKHRDALDEARLFRYCRDQASDTEFFIRKAIGWALRQHAYVNPDGVRAFLDEMGDRLSGLSRREAAKHL
ncbi:MAG: DNA alkylation repair protein [Acidimicrobiia bacterium]|nr:DNA alkylation repair protein [Acidimicrobiia bacterium]